VTTNGTVTTITNLGFGANGLTLGSDGSFYGTLNGGAVFRVTTDGVFTTLYSLGTDSSPLAGVTQGSDGNVYGTTSGIGADQLYGSTAFGMTTNGVITMMASLDLLTPWAFATSGLTLGSDGNFYGTYFDGGSGVGEYLFRVTTNGVLTSIGNLGFSLSFSGDLIPAGDGNLYGTDEGEGVFYKGMVFQMTMNGWNLLASFNGINGNDPRAGLTLGSDGNFYGTTCRGGADDLGVIYRLLHGVSIQSFGMTTNGFQLNTLNVGGSGWVVLESSSDLATWTPIQTNGTAAAQTFLDPAALTQPRQFYRVRQE